MSLNYILTLIQAKLLLLKSLMVAAIAPSVGFALANILFYLVAIAVAAIALYMVAKAVISISRSASHLIHKKNSKTQQVTADNQNSQNKKPAQPNNGFFGNITQPTQVTEKEALEIISGYKGLSGNVLQDMEERIFATTALRSNQTVVTAAVRKVGAALKFASDELKDNKAVVVLAITKDPNALQFASTGMQENIEVLKEAIKLNPSLLRHISHSKFNNEDYRELVMIAVRNNGGTLQHAQNNLNIDMDVLEAAVTSDPKALQYIPQNTNYYTYKNLTLRAVRTRAGALQYARDDMKTNIEVVRAALTKDPMSLQHVNGDAFDAETYKSLVIAAVMKDCRALQYVSNAEMKNDKEVVLMASLGIHVYDDDTDDEKVTEALKYASEELKQDNNFKEDIKYFQRTTETYKNIQNNKLPLMPLQEPEDLLLGLLALCPMNRHREVIMTNGFFDRHLLDKSMSASSTATDNKKMENLNNAKEKPYLVTCLAKAMLYRIKNPEVNKDQIDLFHYEININTPLLEQLSTTQGVIDFVDSILRLNTTQTSRSNSAAESNHSGPTSSQKFRPQEQVSMPYPLTKRASSVAPGHSSSTAAPKT